MMKRAFLAALVLAAALVSANSASAAIPALVGYWPLVEGSGQVVHDFSGYGNNGQLGSTSGVDANDPTWISVNPFIRAMHFGGNQWVSIPSSPVLQPKTITVAALVRAPISPGQWSYVFSKGGFSCTAASYGLYTGFGGGLAFYISDGVNFALSPEAPPTVWNGKWHFVVGTFDGSMLRLFVDGVQVGSGTPTSLAIAYGLASASPFIGAYRGSCDLTFRGDIGQVSVWNGALSNTTILQAAAAVLARLYS
jgi:hypothetical protein